MPRSRSVRSETKFTFNCLRNMSSKVAIPTGISTSDPWGFQFLHVLVSTCYCLSYHSHLSRCEVVSQCGFDLHFQKLVRDWLFMCVFVSEMSVKTFYLFFLGCWFSYHREFSMYSNYKPSTRRVIHQYFLSVCDFCCSLLNVRVSLLFPVLCSFLLYTMNRYVPYGYSVRIPCSFPPRSPSAPPPSVSRI